MAMDGVVLSLPPSDATQRWNFCKIGETHMWRKPSEGASPELSGHSSMGKQVPAARAVPMWGGIGRGGFGLVMFHEGRKVNNVEWSTAVSKGKLKDALTRDAQI